MEKARICLVVVMIDVTRASTLHTQSLRRVHAVGVCPGRRGGKSLDDFWEGYCSELTVWALLRENEYLRAGPDTDQHRGALCLLSIVIQSMTMSHDNYAMSGGRMNTECGVYYSRIFDLRAAYSSTSDRISCFVNP